MHLKRIYEMLEGGKNGGRASKLYSWAILGTIVASLVPLAFREHNIVFDCIEIIALMVFLVDYILRFLTAQYKLKKGKKSFLLYPFTPWAIVDLMAILPSIHIVGKSFKLLKSIKFLKIMEAFKTARIFKALRYIEHFNLIKTVVRKEMHAIVGTLLIVGVYVVSVALIIFDIEIDAFVRFTDALYWSATALFGGARFVSELGKSISVISLIMFVAAISEITIMITIGFLQARGKDDDLR